MKTAEEAAAYLERQAQGHAMLGNMAWSECLLKYAGLIREHIRFRVEVLEGPDAGLLARADLFFKKKEKSRNANEFYGKHRFDCRLLHGDPECSCL